MNPQQRNHETQPAPGYVRGGRIRNEATHPLNRMGRFFVKIQRLAVAGEHAVCIDCGGVLRLCGTARRITGRRVVSTRAEQYRAAGGVSQVEALAQNQLLFTGRIPRIRCTLC